MTPILPRSYRLDATGLNARFVDFQLAPSLVTVCSRATSVVAQGLAQVTMTNVGPDLGH